MTHIFKIGNDVNLLIVLVSLIRNHGVIFCGLGRIFMEYVMFDNIDEPKIGTHCILVYDQPKHMYNFAGWFLKKGLEKKQSSLFITDENPGVVELELRDQGIKTNEWKSQNLLHISKIPKNLADELDLDDLQSVVMQSLNGSEPPYRIFAKICSKIDSEFAKKLIKIEHELNEIMASMPCSLICSFNKEELAKIDPKYSKEIIENHSVVFYASINDKSCSFETDILKK